MTDVAFQVVHKHGATEEEAAEMQFRRLRSDQCELSGDSHVRVPGDPAASVRGVDRELRQQALAGPEPERSAVAESVFQPLHKRLLHQRAAQLLEEGRHPDTAQPQQCG